MFPNVPCTRTTGYGWAELGWREKLLAPGGEADGDAKFSAKPVAKL